MTENELAKIVVHTSIAIHRETGPGLLESVYEAILARELAQQGLSVERQVGIPIHFRDHSFDEGFRADILVNEKLILELKSVESLSKLHRKQVLTYLKLSGLRLGLLLNFGSELMKDGIERIANGIPETQ